MTKLIDVVFSGPALEQWREAFPGLPPGDEIAMKMRLDPCSICGRIPEEDDDSMDVWAINPTAITGDGEIIGERVCHVCLEEGR